MYSACEEKIYVNHFRETKGYRNFLFGFQELFQGRFSFVFIGLTEKEILRQELVAQLCLWDKTHSQLVDLISFETIIYFCRLHTKSCYYA